MRRRLLCRTLLLGFLALSMTTTTASLALAETRPSDTAAIDGASAATVINAANTSAVITSPPMVGERWTAYGYNIVAPRNMWPMLEMLRTMKFDWQLASASRNPTPIEWASLPPNVYGMYIPSQNVVKLSWVLQGSTVEVATAYLAHELTHLTDDLNGRLGDLTGAACYDAETRAFVNEANFWHMIYGPLGKTTQDPLEVQQNSKMWAFVGNPQFADLVVHTTPAYVAQCGRDHTR